MFVQKAICAVKQLGWFFLILFDCFFLAAGSTLIVPLASSPKPVTAWGLVVGWFLTLGGWSGFVTIQEKVFTGRHRRLSIAVFFYVGAWCLATMASSFFTLSIDTDAWYKVSAICAMAFSILFVFSSVYSWRLSRIEIP